MADSLAWHTAKEHR